MPTEELARRQGVKPITSVDDLAAAGPRGSPTRSTRPSSPTSTPPAAPASREPRRRRHRRRLDAPAPPRPTPSPANSPATPRHHLRHHRRADQVDARPPLGSAQPRADAGLPRAARRPPLRPARRAPAGARSRPTPSSAVDPGRSTTPGSPPAASSASCRSPRSTSRTTPTSPSTRASNSSTEDTRRGMSRGTNHSTQEVTRDTGREQKAQVGRRKASAITRSTGLRRRERRFESCRGHYA